MSDDATATIISRIRNNASEEIRVALSEYRGQQLIDVRVFADIRDDGEMLATKKGIACSVARIPALIEALEDAQAEAVRRGLLEIPSRPTDATAAERQRRHRSKRNGVTTRDAGRDTRDIETEGEFALTS